MANHKIVFILLFAGSKIAHEIGVVDHGVLFVERAYELVLCG